MLPTLDRSADRAQLLSTEEQRVLQAATEATVGAATRRREKGERDRRKKHPRYHIARVN